MTPTKPTAPPSMKTGIELISEERIRQLCKEGWTPEHDDTHDMGELLRGGAAYALAANAGADALIPASWPWSQRWWKPSDDPVRNLVKAGALIAAEIDRLQRKRGYKAPPPDRPYFDAEEARAKAGYPNNR